MLIVILNTLYHLVSHFISNDLSSRLNLHERLPLLKIKLLDLLLWGLSIEHSWFLRMDWNNRISSCKEAYFYTVINIIDGFWLLLRASLGFDQLFCWLERRPLLSCSRSCWSTFMATVVLVAFPRVNCVKCISQLWLSRLRFDNNIAISNRVLFSFRIAAIWLSECSFFLTICSAYLGFWEFFTGKAWLWIITQAPPLCLGLQ